MAIVKKVAPLSIYPEGAQHIAMASPIQCAKQTKNIVNDATPEKGICILRSLIDESSPKGQPRLLEQVISYRIDRFAIKTGLNTSQEDRTYFACNDTLNLNPNVHIELFGAL